MINQKHYDDWKLDDCFQDEPTFYKYVSYVTLPEYDLTVVGVMRDGILLSYNLVSGEDDNGKLSREQLNEIEYRPTQKLIDAIIDCAQIKE